MIDEDILIETYCKVKTKEQIIADLKIKSMRAQQRDCLFMIILRSFNEAQLSALLDMADKEALVEFLKYEAEIAKRVQGAATTENDRKLPERFTVDREELALVLTDEIPDWFRTAVHRVVGKNAMPQIWRSRYGYLLRLFKDGTRQHLRMFKELEPEYRQAVERAKEALGKENNTAGEQAMGKE